MMHSMTKAVHDKVAQYSTMLTVGFNCDGVMNTLDANRDYSHIVVAGRTVFKIIAVEDNRFEEKVNLRVGRNLNLNYGAADVAWNQNDDNLIASAPTNRNVVIWDLNRHSKCKQEYVFENLHARTVNRVRFHENEVNLLLSGSQDGCMKLIDVRKHTVGTTFYTSTSIRDIQFTSASYNYFQFAAADESGSIQMWDMRRPDKMERQITAHTGPVFSIDWHPDEKNWIATAGRDKNIKVWDLHKNKLIYTVQTIAPVLRVRWRPQRRYHLASSSLQLDNTISVWNINRPYIPFASFEEHRDATTGVLWKRDDPHLFYSCSKDGMLYQHVFKDACRPADHVIPSGIDMNLMGNISHAHGDRNMSIDDEVVTEPDEELDTDKTNAPGVLSLFSKKQTKSDSFIQAHSQLYVYDACHKEQSLCMSWFVDSAKRYLLKGQVFEKLCEHNAQVAESQDRFQVAQSWRMLMDMYSHPTTHQSRTHSMMAVPGEKQDTEQVFTGKKMEKQDDKDLLPEITSGDLNFGMTWRPFLWTSDNQQDEISSLSGSDEESDKEVIKENLSSIARGQMNPPAEWDILFGVTDQMLDSDFDQKVPDLTTLPSEAFVPRHEIKENPHAMESLQNGQDSPISANESEGNQQTLCHSSRSAAEEEVLVTFSNENLFPNVDYSDVVQQMLGFYAEQGDVQTSVSMLMVLSDKNRPQIDEQIQENWFLSYIELLGRFQLWTIANEIIKSSYLPQVSLLNQQSTRIPLNCQKCNKPMQRVGWLCDRCKSVVNLCVVCHHPVKGLFLWCQGCSHGGHFHHIQEWVSYKKCCPAGCGHICEYT